MKKDYVKPEMKTFQVMTGCSLLAGSSFTQSTTESVETMNSGSFGSRENRSLWDDEEDEY